MSDILIAESIQGDALDGVGGEADWSREGAASYFRRAASAITKPLVYLSAGVTNSAFNESLEFALQYGPGFTVCFVAALRRSGVYQAGRIRSAGMVVVICRINRVLESAAPWHGVYNLSLPSRV